MIEGSTTGWANASALPIVVRNVTFLIQFAYNYVPETGKWDTLLEDSICNNLLWSFIDDEKLTVSCFTVCIF